MAKNPLVSMQARDDFNKARSRELFSRIIYLMRPQRQELLNFHEIRSLIRPRSETYKGLTTVNIDDIVGSEGRYQDFNKAFLPKRDHIRSRWENVDKAHLTDVILPPILLYKIGNAYFVRDGNHRVSVAKSQGGMNIDAEVIELGTEINIDSSMTMEDVKQALIRYEIDKVYKETELGKIIPREELELSATGRIFAVLEHINVHKYFINEERDEEMDYLEAVKSWYENLFRPITRTLDEGGILARFPGRTKADLYLWIMNHWDALKGRYGDDVPIEDAAKDFSRRFGRSFFQRVLDFFKPSTKKKRSGS